MKRFKLILILCVCVILVNCANLDENLKDKWTNTNFLNTPAEVKAAVDNSYQTTYTLLNSGGFYDLQEITTDEMMLPQRGGDWYDGGSHLQLTKHIYNGDSNGGIPWYSKLFGGISTCNRLLATPAVASNVSFVAELHVLRAYYYFLLLDMWGNVPIVTQLGQAQPQSTRAQVYEFIEREITTYQNSLSKTNGTSDYGHLTYYGAQSVLAKMYLNAQVYTGTPQWEKTVKACDQVINSGFYNLEAILTKIFDQNNNGSKEHIFVVPYDHVYGHGLQIASVGTLHYSSQFTYTMTQQPWNGYCSLEDFYNSFDKDDARKKESFLVGEQFYPDGITPITDASYEKVSPNPADPNAIADPDGEIVYFTPHVNELAPNCLKQAGARIGKYTQYQGMTSDMDNDYPIFRYADILMMKAEALFNLNGYADATGLALINQVHKRAGLPAYTSMSATELLAERGREFFAEAWRRNDLIRFGKFGGTWFSKPNVDPDNHFTLFPFPTTQITATAKTQYALKQNPGYDK